MALADGLDDVRSTVCMQFPLHPVTSHLNTVKAALKVDKVLARVGLHTVKPRSGSDPQLGARRRAAGGTHALAERCGKPLCRWINAIYGCTHAHDQLNDATHDELDDMFGVGNLAALGHMGTIMNRRLVVDASGDEAYTRNPERIQVPVLLVQGERNYIFRPAGSMRTLRWLQTANEPSLYERGALGLRTSTP